MPHLPSHPAHLGRSATAATEPGFTGMDWFDAYTARHAADGVKGRLVSQYGVAESWS